MEKMKIKCPKCQKFFEANSQQKTLIDRAIDKNMKLLFVECPECCRNVPINPSDLLSTEPQKDEDIEQFECPICHEGIVCYVSDDDEKFWGCGECGNVWFSKSELDNAINECKAT